ncbi:MAG: right-handed parallel beta-helix repeat-containing protein [Candidatus Hydrogenedentes bacterium]|nr:right-handed parallel beta-helix repeat-containing protein [Candidatus Hydrogenedentota bacterium]
MIPKNLVCSVAVAILAGVFVCAVVASAEPAHLFVAPNGNDAWTGSLDAPNAEGTDGPLASLTGARDALRKLRATGPLAEGAVVEVLGGDYPVTEAVRFAPEDSGTQAGPIVFRARAGEQPVISGGRVITGWKQEGQFWVADVPAVREGTWHFSALWVNGERRQPARTPNAAHPWGDNPPDSDDFRTVGPVVEKDADGKDVKSATKFIYNPGDLQPWEDLDDAFIVVFHSWATSLLRVKNLDEQNHIVEFTGPARWNFGYWQNDQRYYIEHLFEGLDAPGEWYLNRKTGKLYYIPMPGEDMNAAKVLAPVAPQLLLLEGAPAEGRYVEHLNFEGIDFCFTEYTLGPEGLSDAQAEVTVNATVETVGARNCSFVRCDVKHIGNYAVWFRTGSQSNLLRQCELYDMGAGGVRIGEQASPATPGEAAERNVVDNNFIHDGGRTLRAAVGMWIGRSSFNDVTHNEICDFRYSGVSVGWSWGYAESSANNNHIDYNHIHHIGLGQLNDMGGIYTLGISPGTTLFGNVIHDVMSHPRLYGGWGLYTDEGSSEILLANNLVYHTRTGTFHQHYGRDNRVVNNILAFSLTPQIIRSREEDHNSFFFEHNIVYFNNGSLLGSTWGNWNWVADNNCYWDTSGMPVDFAGRTWEEWRAGGCDRNSIEADPLFENAEAGDFRLKPNSPALKVGFVPFDFTKAGLYGDPEWVALPKKIAREPFTAPAQPEPTNISDDFEGTEAGANATDAHTLGEEGAAQIRVTAETAAAGKQSLKFTDAEGLDKAFNPHLVYAPHLRAGVAVGGFSIRVEPGAEFYHEWRDGRNPYRVGPSIWVDGEGNVKANGAVKCKIPLSQWAQVRIVCGLGKEANGTYDLEITAPGAETQRFDDIPCGSPNFYRLDWYGFVSNATHPAAFYIDNVDVHIEGAVKTAKLLSVEKIWDAGGHNAFTDLIRFNDRWYCTFREADGHVKGDGRIRIITSADGATWESAALLEEAGIDLRDPKLCITPDNRLMSVMGGSVYREGKLVGRQPRVAFSSDGTTWTAPQRVLGEGDWLWRVTWNEGVAYGVTYRREVEDAPEWDLELVRATDGINYEKVAILEIPGRPNETTVRFMPDGEMIALVRREAETRSGWIGTSRPPYTEWTWTDTGVAVGGPNFIRLPDGDLWAAGRFYPNGPNTVLARMTRTSYEPVLTLPSGGDTSYPGLVWHDGILWMSYYSSHEGKTSIYLAKIALE